MLAEQLGISLSQAEHDLELQAQAGNIGGELQTRLGAVGYAGMWFDPRSGTFNISIAPATDEASAMEVAAVAGVAGSTVLHYVSHNWSEVEAAAQYLRTKLSGLPAQTAAVITSAQTDQPIVELAEGRSTSVESEVDADAANASIPAKVVQLKQSSLEVRADKCSFPNCDMPLKGGVRIASTEDPYTDTVAVCTAGVDVHDGSGNQYVLTAGHCSEGGNGYFNYPHDWFAETSTGHVCELGPPIAGEVGSRMDAEVIAAPRGCGSIAAGIVEWGVIENYPVQGSVTAYPGLFECHMGEHSENQCGDVESSNISVEIDYESGAKIVEHMDQVCALSRVGDSGGPWQYGNTEWTYITGIDIASAGEKACSEGGRAFAYELHYAEAFIGVALTAK